MSKIVEYFLIPLFFILSIIYTFNSLGNNVVELKKVFHHKAGDDMYLEYANLSLYFSHEPHVQNNELLSSDQSKVFFIPCAVNDDECNTMIQRVNSYNGDHKFAIEKAFAPQEGIIITSNFDPKKIALSYELFDSIGMQKGIVFRLHNKEVLDALQQKQDQPILRILSREQKPCIVIDPGHGGYDSGAISPAGVTEKTVCLAISKNIAHLLQRQGYSASLTRTEDVGLLLDERTTYANQRHADLFVSIHANYAYNTHSNGIETFCIKPNLFKEQFSMLSLQDKKNNKKLFINKTDVSHKVALSIQKYLCNTDMYHNNFKVPINRKTKFSVSQVLLGTQMPSVLVEVGFLSHPEEVQLLVNQQYQKLLAECIVEGIVAALPL